MLAVPIRDPCLLQHLAFYGTGAAVKCETPDKSPGGISTERHPRPIYLCRSALNGCNLDKPAYVARLPQRWLMVSNTWSRQTASRKALIACAT